MSFFYSVVQQPVVLQGRPPSQGLKITLRYITISRNLLDGLSLPENTQHSQQTDIDATGGIRTSKPSKRTAEDTRLRRSSHRDRHVYFLLALIKLKESHSRPGVAQRVPRDLGSQIFMTFGTSTW
jgi:hypothetical protein